jgi:hypothetical protein
VRRGVERTVRLRGDLPSYLTARVLSVRAYDQSDEMVDAEVVPGPEAAALFERFLARADVAYLHVHYAKRGCYACRVERAGD